MVTLPISEALARKLEAIAQRQNRTLEEMLVAVADQFQPNFDEQDAEETASSTTLFRIEDAPRYQQTKRDISGRTYARAYWQEVGNRLRAVMTDDELLERFWKFDDDGIPRLKEDQTPQGARTIPLLQRLDRQYQRLVVEGNSHLIATEATDTRKLLTDELPNNLLSRIDQADEA